MAAARPLVTVFNTTDASDATQLPMPAVMKAPIRPDIVKFVFSNMALNNRQPYAVSKKAGHQTSAESWGTGRAVSRIPRVPGGGTQRSGQGAFGNMCRGGRMFAPTKIWRKWHRRINVNQRRYAVASALAASAVTPLVMARGHRVEELPELPLVLSPELGTVSKTKEATAILERFGAMEDVDKCKKSVTLRAGKGKMRNRRYTMRRGPLVVYAEGENPRKAFRNLAGVDMCPVEALNLTMLAPGGHVGRFCIWTQAAFAKLDVIFGTPTEAAALKGYTLPRHKMTNPDVGRIINSDEVQSIVRPAIKFTRRLPRKKNPLRNRAVMVALNPFAQARSDREAAKREMTAEKRAEVLQARRAEAAVRKSLRNRRREFIAKASEEGPVSF